MVIYTFRGGIDHEKSMVDFTLFALSI